MLKELGISSDQVAPLIKPHCIFLELVEEKEQLEWSEILLRKHPDLYAFRTSINNFVKPRDALGASVYMLASARTLLACRFLLHTTGTPIIIGKNEVNSYASAMVQNLHNYIGQQPHDPTINTEILARTKFFMDGAYPPSAVSWMANFFSDNINLAINFILPEKSYPAESERYMYRGILDMAYPIVSALRNKTPYPVADPKLLPNKI